MKQLALSLSLVLAFLPSCVGIDETSAEPEALTYTQTVEAETATGPATVVSDASASGGQLLRMSVFQTVYLSFSTTGFVQNVTLRARRASGTCNPVVYVTLDGIALSHPTITSSTWADYAAGATSFPAGAHSLSLYYRIGASGCQLDVDDLALTIYEPPPPVTTIYEAEAATGSGTIESDVNAHGGQLRSFTTPYTAATLTVTTTGTITNGSVRVRGGVCNPFGRVSIDGNVVWYAFASNASWTDVAFSGPGLPAGTHTIELYPRAASASCPLRFDSVTLVTQ